MHRDNCTVYALEPVCRSVALQAFQCITPADTREKNYSWEAMEKFPAFYGTQTSLPHSQQPAICPYPESDRSSPYPLSHLWRIHFNIINPFAPGSSEWSSPSFRFPHQNPLCIYRLPHTATLPAHLSLLDLITWIIFYEEHRAWNFSLCGLRLLYQLHKYTYLDYV